MAKSSLVRVEDVRAVLRIFRTTLDMPADLAIRSAHVVADVCRVLDACSGLLGLVEPAWPNGPLFIVHGIDGIHPGIRARQPYQQYGAVTNPRDPRMLALNPTRLEPHTDSRCACIDDHTWCRDMFVNELKFRLSSDNAIYSLHPVAGGRFVGLGVNREKGGRPFGRHEQAILELVCGELDWLCWQCWPQEKPAPSTALPPRSRQILTELLGGASEKEIACRLGLSTHTVHCHIKRIYRRFSVTSRAELMALYAVRPSQTGA